ncbi:palmitoyl-protein thioesterase 1-like [Peromyscus californicus insignis]|uniref:palmitoyl-protein thioesterase 1-like n=1 Tax=Peromyscus californicus insignis TaxID=564181 RepID=UPI0022A774EC|nr:palmitoyl-protein thioesterase 1-like [Peromyscus californicus insignis]
MVLPGSQWLLSVCLLSWCCDAWELRSVDPESESPTPLVIWYEEGDMINIDTLKKVVEKSIPGMYIVPLEIGKNLMEDVENNVLNASSEVCEILAKNPKLQQGYIAVIVSKKIQML